MSANSATVALYSVDPISLDAFHSFDPESFSVIPLINDALVIIGLDGEVEPGLAVRWTQVSPVQVDFELRRGVHFHNGELMTADDVVATFAAHRGPTPSACGGGILSPIVNVERLDEYRVRMTTAFPDGMLLRRLFFGQIYPKSVLQTEGRDAFLEHPIGTGAYELVHWRRGDEILLRRNKDHWAGKATIDELRLPILRQKEWTARLEAGELDIALNADSHQVVCVDRIDGLHSASRDAALSQWFLLSNKGPLADPRVRRALNHAINQPLLVDITEHGLGKLQRTVATEEQEGFNGDVVGYRYSPDLARRLLAEAGYADGFTLRGLVSETSSTLYAAVREFLARVGVKLEAEVVPRADWIGRVVVSKITGQGVYDGDFAVASVDNPLLHSLFHQFIFLFSQGPFSLMNDPEYDQAFLAAATEVDADKALKAQQELERYARDRALMLFTVQQKVHMVAREGFSVDLPRSGHFDAAAFWSISKAENAVSAGQLQGLQPPGGERGRLLHATSHLGLFHMAGDVPLRDDVLDGIWRNVEASQHRWHLQMEPMVRELVSLSEARTNLDHVLESTNRVAIVGVSLEGTKVFTNAGYSHMFGDEVDQVTALLGQIDGEVSWKELIEQVEQSQSWAGPVVLPTDGRPEGAAPKLYLTITPSHDPDGSLAGHTLVFSDFSGEEERIRSGAIRVILDHVAHGLLRCDAEGKVMPGYSSSCESLLKLQDDMEGQSLVDVLRLSSRDADHFSMCFEQVFWDILPEEMTLGQIPSRIQIGDTAISLAGRAIRNERGDIASVLMTVVDITDLIEAEREAERFKGLVQVLRFKDRFSQFVQELANDLKRLITADDVDQRARTVLHTAKGVFGQFNIHDLVRIIHRVEDAKVIEQAHVQEVYDAVDELLAAHFSVWQIKLGVCDRALKTNDARVQRFEEQVLEAGSAEELRALALTFAQDIRRRTVAELIGPLAESARQHAARRSKKAELHVVGADLTVPDRLSDVFGVITHLVRNAIDHGVEAEGCRPGKPDVASLELRVEREPDGLSVSLRDDGAGIDVEAVANKAVQDGVISPQQRTSMSKTDKCALIFSSGLSTAEVVSDTSGRGVGMAAVREAVEAQGGSIQIETATGEGTCIRLHFAHADAPRALSQAA